MRIKIEYGDFIMVSKIKTLIFSVFNLVIPLVLLCVQTIGSNHHFYEVIIFAPCTILIGAIIGGVLPLIIAIVYKVDISACFVHQVIIVAISIAVCFLSWIMGISGTLYIIAPIIWGFMILMYWEKITSKKNELSMQKVLVLSLSNPLMLYLGIVLDFTIAFSSSGSFNIPG